MAIYDWTHKIKNVAMLILCNHLFIKQFGMKKTFFFFFSLIILYACGNQNSHSSTTPDNNTSTTAENPSYDPQRGEGKFSNIQVPATIDEKLVAEGNKVFTVKCSACHKLTEEKLVGPGWKGVTGRHKAEWIMNFVTNTDAMINKDPKVQAQLEICLVRMPNQNISDDEAKNVYEFMRKNDSKK